MGVTRRLILLRTAAFAAAVLGPATAYRSEAAERQAKEHLVVINKFRFSPERVDIRMGDTITWLNKDIAPHTATATDRSWDTGEIKRGDRKSLLVTANMEQTYFCRFHPKMVAEISIVAD